MADIAIDGKSYTYDAADFAKWKADPDAYRAETNNIARGFQANRAAREESSYDGEGGFSFSQISSRVVAFSGVGILALGAAGVLVAEGANVLLAGGAAAFAVACGFAAAGGMRFIDEHR